MTILTELARLYDRLVKTGKDPPHGYSLENIGGEVVLDSAGNVLAIRDLRVADEKGKAHPRKKAHRGLHPAGPAVKPRLCPASVNPGSGAAPCPRKL